jgi:site-specific DNA-methyltransferase (adenine-specific)
MANDATAGAAMTDLRLGRWQDVLADVECDSLITDPPYSERTVNGQRSGRRQTTRKSGWANTEATSRIDYSAWVCDDCVAFLESWIPRVRHWLVMFGDHVVMRWIEDTVTEHGWWFFQRVWLKTDGAPCFNGTGPDMDVEFVAICRPIRGLKKRHRGGSFYGATASERRKQTTATVGAKPLWLMQQAVLRYSEPGDLIADPFAGTGTTGEAAVITGRQFIGCEVDERRHRYAARRIAAAVAQPLLVPLHAIQVDHKLGRGKRPVAEAS